jgi:hypothetical protein
MTIYTQVVTTEETELTNVKSPALPLAPTDYSRQYQDQLNSVLRLYFNQIDTLRSQLRLGLLNTLALPNGAFYQDGVTTLTTGINNTSTADIVVASTADFVLSSGGIIIGSEIITYTGKTATTFTGITRGAYGSTKASHSAGVYVTEAQTLASASVAAPLALLATTSSNGVALDATDKTKIVFSTAGYYNIQFSIQMLTFDTSLDNVTIWFRLNGVDIPYSAGVATVPAKHGSGPGTAIISWNLVQPVNAGDYIQLLFASTTGNTVAATYPPGTSPVHPTSPSIIVTATFTSAL